MKEADSSWPYWSIDLPGLSRSSAEELLQVAQQEDLSVSGLLVDPALFLTLHIDRETVDAVCNALSRVDPLFLELFGGLTSGMAVMRGRGSGSLKPTWRKSNSPCCLASSDRPQSSDSTSYAKF
jgi:hypothetical protein